MARRWVTNLKRIAKECKNRTYEFGNKIEEEMCSSYYIEQYRMEEEDFTFDEAVKTEKNIDTYVEAIRERYPDANIEW